MTGIEFVNRIDELLSSSGKTRADINSALGFNRNTIAQWKQRNNIPTGDICLNIAQYLNTSVEYLLTGKTSFLNSELKDVKEDIIKAQNFLTNAINTL